MHDCRSRRRAIVAPSAASPLSARYAPRALRAPPRLRVVEPAARRAPVSPVLRLRADVLRPRAPVADLRPLREVLPVDFRAPDELVFRVLPAAERRPLFVADLLAPRVVDLRAAPALRGPVLLVAFRALPAVVLRAPDPDLRPAVDLRRFADVDLRAPVDLRGLADLRAPLADDFRAPADVDLRAPLADDLREVLLLRVEALLLRRVDESPPLPARPPALVFLRAAAAPPLRPPSRAGSLLVARPLPEPLFLPPPSILFTVAHARRSASLRGTPRFS